MHPLIRLVKCLKERKAVRTILKQISASTCWLGEPVKRCRVKIDASQRSCDLRDSAECTDMRDDDVTARQAIVRLALSMKLGFDTR